MLPSAPGLHRIREGIPLPSIVVRGSSPGPTLVVSEGVRTLFETCEALDPTSLHGTVVAVLIVNYPGRPDGSPTERLAWAFDTTFLPLADFYLDFHRGGGRFAVPSMVGFEAAEAFGAPVICGHPIIEPGRTISADLLMIRRGITNLLRHRNILPPPLRLQTDEGVIATAEGF